VLSKRRLTVMLALAITSQLLLRSTPAAAQNHAQPRQVSGPVVVSHAYHPAWYYGGWYPWGPYPYPYYWYPYPYGYGFWDDLTTSVKLEVDQREAEVFVDGYRAGVVDNFDGTFQRLRLRPGAHEVVVYLDGYRTIRENVYMSSGTDKKVRLTMERVDAGEQSEPPPQPSSDSRDDSSYARPGEQPGRQASEGGVLPPRMQPQEQVVLPGTVSLRVEPGDAEVFFDGQRWGVFQGNDRVRIAMPEGRHRIEVQKTGFATYTEDLLVRPGATLTLNVGLKAPN